MTFLPQGYNGTLPVNLSTGNVANQTDVVEATIDLTAANFGSGNSSATLAQSPNQNGDLSTFELLQDANVLNLNSHPPIK